MMYPELMQPTSFEYSVSTPDYWRQSPPLIEDNFKISIGVFYQSTGAPSTTMRPLLYCPSRCIRIQSFFQEEGQQFLLTLLSHLHLRFSAEIIDEITHGAVCTVRRMFQTFKFNQSLAGYASNNMQQPQEFPLNLVITLFYDNDDMHAVMEESMLDFRMIPATKEAIQMSLKKSTVVKENESCTICMEKFDVVSDGGDDQDDDDNNVTKSCAMPCNHVFHRQCIVSWLQTSHVCPLCRYPLPTASDD